MKASWEPCNRQTQVVRLKRVSLTAAFDDSAAGVETCFGCFSSRPRAVLRPKSAVFGFPEPNVFVSSARRRFWAAREA